MLEGFLVPLRYISLAVGGFLVMLVFQNCSAKLGDSAGNSGTAATCLSQLGNNTEWSSEAEVIIDGYSADAMEPKTSSDQVVLFFNDNPSNGEKHLHYAILQSNGHYQYVGQLPGANAAGSLYGVPAIDNSGNFYFVSTSSYSSNYQSLYGGQVQVLGPSSLQINNVAAADANVSAKTNGTLDMDVDVSWDGSSMVASRAVFSGASFPDTSRLVLFSVSNRIAATVANSATILSNVNLSACRIYAGNFSNDMKEIYYTVVPTGAVAEGDFRVVVAKRAATGDAFGAGSAIAAISGKFTEAPSLSLDGKTLMYHRKDLVSGRLKIYKVVRP